MNAWVRSQPKTLRPYFGVQKAEGLLNDMELVMKFGDAPLQTNRLVVDDDQIKDMAPRLYPKLSEERINDVFGDRRSAFDLIVTLRTPQMLRRELVAQYSLGNDAPECIELPQNMLKDAKLTGLFEVALSICLAKEVDLGPGWPKQMGSWVTKKVYTIGLDRTQSAFRILPLTETLAKSLSLPKGTFVFVDDIEDLNSVYEEGSSCATAYVSENILLSSAAGKSVSAVAALIWSEIASAILLANGNGISEAQEVASGSPLEAILENLRPDRRMTLSELKTLIDNPIRLRAAVHDSRGLVKDLEKV